MTPKDTSPVRVIFKRLPFLTNLFCGIYQKQVKPFYLSISFTTFGLVLSFPFLTFSARKLGVNVCLSLTISKFDIHSQLVVVNRSQLNSLIESVS